MATTTNFGWTTPDDTDLVKDGAAAIRTLGSAIDTSLVDLKGGTTGQVLSKASNTDLDYSWTTPTDQTPLTTKGDLFGYSTADARIPVGANGTVLTADSAETLGVKWATPAGGGKVLQVVYGSTNTATTNTTTTYEDTNLTATITPSSASSKVLVLINQCGVKKSSEASTTSLAIRAFRDAEIIGTIGTSAGNTQGTAINLDLGSVSGSILDTPATTSATVYKTQFKSNTGGGETVTVQNGTALSTIVLMEIGA